MTTATAKEPQHDYASGVAAPRLQLLVVCVASFVVWAGFGAILPYLPVFLQEQTHASVSLIGVIAAAYYVGTFVFSAILGRASDTVGRKPMIVMGVSLYAIATLLFISTTEPAWFILFRLLEGIGAAAVGPAGQAFIADITTDRNRSQAYGWLTTAQFGGLVAGPAMAWPLYELGGGQGTWAFYAVFLVGSILAAATAVVLLLTIREPDQNVRRRRERAASRTESSSALRAAARFALGGWIRSLAALFRQYRELITRPILAFIVVAATGHFAMGAWEVLWSIWLRHLGASMRYVGLTWIAFSVPMLLSFVGGYLADRYNRFLLMFSGYAISALSWVVYGATRNLTAFIVFNVIEGIAVAYSYPAKQAFLVQVSPRRWLGTIQGAEGTAMQLAALIGTLTAPLLYDVIGGFAISVGGFISLVGLAFAAPILRREWRRLSREGPAPAAAAQAPEAARLPVEAPMHIE